MRKCLTLLKCAALVFILIAMTNLAIELFLVSRIYTVINSDGLDLLKKIYIAEDSDTTFLLKHAKDISEGYQKTNYMFSVGLVRDFSDADSFNGATDGRRITSAESLKEREYQGIMLGASQSWGYFVEDKHLVSQLLMDRMTNVAIDNYSLLGVTLDQSLSYWQSVEHNLDDKKFVIVIGGVFDVMSYCHSEPNRFHHKPHFIEQIGLVSFYNKLISKLNLGKNLIYCSDSVDIDQIVQRVSNSIELIMLEAKRNNMKALIVIPPVPLFGSPNVNNFSSEPSFLQMKKAMYPVYEALNRRLHSLDSASVINLMRAFDDSAVYFLDPMGHLNERGHEKLAEEIINHVGEDFFKNY